MQSTDEESFEPRPLTAAVLYVTCYKHRCVLSLLLQNIIRIIILSISQQPPSCL